MLKFSQTATQPSNTYFLTKPCTTLYKKWGGVTAIAASLLAISAPAQALSIISTYPQTNDLSNDQISDVDFAAFGFTLPNNGIDYSLDSVTLRLEFYTSAGDDPLLRIYADSNRTSSDPLSAVLQSVTFAEPSSDSIAINNFDFFPNSQFTFNANTRYWLVLSNQNNNVFQLRGSFPPVTPTSSVGVTFSGNFVSFNGGNSYTSNAFPRTFQVNATPVPFEFSPALGLGVVGAAFVIKQKFKKKLVKKAK